MNTAAGETQKISSLQVDWCYHSKGRCRGWGGGQCTPGALIRPVHPCCCFPCPPFLLSDFHQRQLLLLLLRRCVLNDVSILPPSLQPHHYNKAALTSSSAQISILLNFPNLGGVGGDRTWVTGGTLFLKGHRTLDSDQDEVVALKRSV